MTSRIDLHLHSTASDGAYAPEEVVQIALANQMDVIALTDHDTVGGVQRAQQAAQGTGLTVIAGVELSAEDEKLDRHILGYFLDVTHPAMLKLFATLREARVNRVVAMVEKLSALGITISVERVLEIAKGGSVGRPHVARAMLQQEAVNTLQEAFDRYIGDDQPAYVPHFQLSPRTALEAIHAAGGIAVLAHPGRYPDYRPILEELLPLGLDGLEVYYPDHPPGLITELRFQANKHNLWMTAGSDFHRREGDGSARIGTVRYPPDLNMVELLRARGIL